MESYIPPQEPIMDNLTFEDHLTFEDRSSKFSQFS